MRIAFEVAQRGGGGQAFAKGWEWAESESVIRRTARLVW